MTIQEAKINYEVKLSDYNTAEEGVANSKKGVVDGVTQVVKDMYGVEVTYVDVRHSIWNEYVNVVITVGGVDFRFRIGGSTGFNVDLPSIDNTLDGDIVIFAASLLMDFNGKTGGYSVIKSLCETLIEDHKIYKESTYQLDGARSEYEKLKREKKEEMFYEVVKGGDIIKRTDMVYWKVTKVTEKCVYAIHRDYHDVKSRRYKKSEFFSETNSYVNFDEVEG